MANYPVLCHFDGTNGSQTFVNENGAGPSLVPVGVTSITTAHPVFGTGAGDFNIAGGGGIGTALHTSTTLTFTGPFTVETFVEKVGFNGTIWTIGQDGTPGGLRAYHNVADVGIEYTTSTVGSNTTITNDSTTAFGAIGSGGGQHHFAICRDASNNVYMFVDGVLLTGGTNVYAGTLTGQFIWGDYLMSDGTTYGSMNNGGSAGVYMDETRISDDTCLYTANFTPPTGPFSLGAVSIAQQPQRQTVANGATATFSVTAIATGGTATYQWQDNRSGTFANVIDGSGGTTATYTTAAMSQATQGRAYQCVVTVSPATATTIPAQVSVLFPLYTYSTNLPSGNNVWLRAPTSTSVTATLAAASASYAVAVPDWATPVARPTSFAAASYAVSAPAAALTLQHPLAVSTATYAVAVPDQATIVARVLSVAPSSYAVAVPDEALTVQHPLAVSPASYAVAVPALSVIGTYAPAVSAASYAISAPAAALSVQHPLSAATATYAIGTTSAALLAAYAPGASAASYAVSAPAVLMTVQHPLAVAPASYAVSAPDEGTAAVRTWPVSPATYAVNAPDVSIGKGSVYNLPVSPSSYAVTAPDEATIRATFWTLNPASYGVSEPAALLGHGQTLSASPMPLLVAPIDVGTLLGRTLSVSPATYALSTPDVLLGKGYQLGVVPTVYTLVTPDIGRTVQMTMPVDAQAYDVNANNVALIKSLSLVGGYSERIMTLQPEDRMLVLAPPNRFIPPM